jgi:hypothetical protein
MIARILALLLLSFAVHAQTVYPFEGHQARGPVPAGRQQTTSSRAASRRTLDAPRQARGDREVGGAGGLIGTEMVAKAAPDGYNLLLISVAFAFSPSMYKLSYDPATAFAPVAVLGAGPWSSR